jgi:hypothetical protein
VFVCGDILGVLESCQQGGCAASSSASPANPFLPSPADAGSASGLFILPSAADAASPADAGSASGLFLLPSAADAAGLPPLLQREGS